MTPNISQQQQRTKNTKITYFHFHHYHCIILQFLFFVVGKKKYCLFEMVDLFYLFVSFSFHTCISYTTFWLYKGPVIVLIKGGGKEGYSRIPDSYTRKKINMERNWSFHKQSKLYELSKLFFMFIIIIKRKRSNWMANLSLSSSH